MTCEESSFQTRLVIQKVVQPSAAKRFASLQNVVLPTKKHPARLKVVPLSHELSRPQILLKLARTSLKSRNWARMKSGESARNTRWARADSKQCFGRNRRKPDPPPLSELPRFTAFLVRPPSYTV